MIDPSGWIPVTVALPLPGRDVLVSFRGGGGGLQVRHLQVVNIWDRCGLHREAYWYPGGGQLLAADGTSWSFWRELPL